MASKSLTKDKDPIKIELLTNKASISEVLLATKKRTIED